MNEQPTAEQKAAFCKDIDTIVMNHLNCMLNLERFDGVDKFMQTLDIHDEVPTHVLESIIIHTERSKDLLPFRSVFINRVEENAKMRDEYTEGQFDKYR